VGRDEGLYTIGVNCARPAPITDGCKMTGLLVNQYLQPSELLVYDIMVRDDP